METKIKEISEDFAVMKEGLEGQVRSNCGMIKGMQEDLSEMKKAFRE